MISRLVFSLVLAALALGGLYLFQAHTPVQGADGRTVLMLATTWSDDELAPVLASASEFEARHGVVVQVIALDEPEYASALQLLHEADTAPDLYIIRPDWAAALASEGIIGPIPDDLASDSAAGLTFVASPSQWLIGVAQRSKHPDVAWEFIRWLTGKTPL